MQYISAFPRVLAALLLICGAAEAQRTEARRSIDTARLAGLLSPVEGEEELDCEVHPIRPALNYSFRFQTGFVVNVRTRQYEGPRHYWSMLAEVTPVRDESKRVFIAERTRLPNIPAAPEVSRDHFLQFGGSLHLGEGKYRVRWVLEDDLKRVCRASWTVEAKLGRGDRNVQLRLPPDTAEAMSSPSKSLPPLAGVPPLRLTVLLHAAPIMARRTRFAMYDQYVLLSTLLAFLEQVPAEKVRLIIYNLDRQRELLRDEEFSLNELRSVASALTNIELGEVDISTLNNVKGHVELLSNLLNGEFKRDDPSDALVFLGPGGRYYDKVPENLIAPKPEGVRAFYFRQKSYFDRRDPFADSIGMAVKRLGGRTMDIHSPAEFADAIEKFSKAMAAPR